MAELTVQTPDELIDALERMANIDSVAPMMLLAGIEPVKKAIVKNLRKHKQSGELINSVTVGKPKKNKDGDWAVRVTFKGYDKETKVPNPIKMIALEYGTSDQIATPVIRPAKIATEKEAITKMQDVYEFECKLDKVKL